MPDPERIFDWIGVSMTKVLERSMSRGIVAVALLILPLAAAADQAGISVDHAWARAALIGHTGAVYLTITDNGTPDHLTAASTPVAESSGVHQSYAENGVMKMRPVAALEVAPGKPATLAPGGYHVMLTGLKQSLSQGDRFPLTLTFEHATPVTVEVEVESAGAGAGGSSRGSGHEMDMKMPMK